MFFNKAEWAMEEVAKEEGIGMHSVVQEIEAVIAEGISNTDPAVREFWRTIPCKGSYPTPVELIEYLSFLGNHELQLME